MVFAWLLVYYSTYREETIEGLALLKVRPFLLGDKRKNDN